MSLVRIEGILISLSHVSLVPAIGSEFLDSVNRKIVYESENAVAMQI
jgi:hypothetical protein